VKPPSKKKRSNRLQFKLQNVMAVKCKTIHKSQPLQNVNLK